MTQQLKPERPPLDSLIQRAAEIYDFKRMQRDTSPISSAFAPSAPSQPAHAPGAQAPWPTVEQPVSMQVAPRKNAPEGPVERVDLALLKENGLIVPGAPPTRISEEFRIVKRHLLLTAFGGSNQQPIRNGRCILVCSAQPNEGKTFSSVNLALSLATEPDLEIVLVDADVAKPEVLSILGIGGGAGLTDALVDPSIDVESLIVRTDIPRLSVLPAGRQTHNDTELLASARGKVVIDSLHKNHPNRVVIIDTAPALAASPASALVNHVGQVILVVRADRTSEHELREAVGMMAGHVELRLLLNGTTYQGMTRNYGSYYGYGEVQ